MHFGNFTDMKPISQHFSDCGLRNDKSTKNSPRENCVNRASVESGESSDFITYLFMQSENSFVGDTWNLSPEGRPSGCRIQRLLARPDYSPDPGTGTNLDAPPAICR